MNELGQLTVTQDRTRFRTKNQEGVAGALDLVNGNGLRLLRDQDSGEGGGRNEHDSNKILVREDAERIAPNHSFLLLRSS